MTGDGMGKTTMDRIASAAVPLFAVRGFAAVSVKEVADAAGVNIALISYYFGGKEKLYLHVLENQLQTMVDELTAIDRDNAPPSDKLQCFVRNRMQVNKKYPYWGRMIHSEKVHPTKSGDSIVQTAFAKLHVFLCNCIQGAIDSGECDAGINLDCAALMLVGITQSFGMVQSDKPDFPEYMQLQEELYLTQAMRIFLYGLMKPKDETVQMPEEV